jgi:hypothetical protein
MFEPIGAAVEAFESPGTLRPVYYKNTGGTALMRCGGTYKAGLAELEMNARAWATASRGQTASTGSVPPAGSRSAPSASGCPTALNAAAMALDDLRAQAAEQGRTISRPQFLSNTRKLANTWPETIFRVNPKDLPYQREQSADRQDARDAPQHNRRRYWRKSATYQPEEQENRQSR